MPADALAAAIERLPAGFLHAHIRHLLYCEASNALEQSDIFAALTGYKPHAAVHLVRTPLFRAGIARLPLRRLHANLGDLFLNTEATPAHISSSQSDWQTGHWAGLAVVHCLTHFSFVCYGSHPPRAEAFRTCPLLRVLVFILDPDYEPEELDYLSKQQPRVVIWWDDDLVSDWHRGACGLGEYAEGVIEERKLSGR
ncbi:hypothetical protein C8F04DRAFT_1263504 [Mycena alexandri]|uniref:Uncharacterized protein n=1 Tax=Mycena alexandri TaxID=1745969 RepID=A0AAD6SPN2_9AGAR|nr:hypothetical protein C8F04DRAFT_1263504 [Mycena alexandri]